MSTMPSVETYDQDKIAVVHELCVECPNKTKCRKHTAITSIEYKESWVIINTKCPRIIRSESALRLA